MEKLRSGTVASRKKRNNTAPTNPDSTPPNKSEIIESIQRTDTFYSDRDVQLSGTKFDRKRQLQRLIISGTLRFVFTIGIIGSLYATFIHFENHGLISPHSKRIFNFLVTGLSMILGISIASSFKSIATDVRWWILSRRKRPIEEVNGILACHSLIEVAKLAVGSVKRRNIGLAVGCCLWLLLNFTAQAAVASLGLTYGLNQDPESDYTHPVPGLVTFTNMSQSFAKEITGGDDSYDNVASSQLAAHTFGQNALQYLYLPLVYPYEADPSPYLSSFYTTIIWAHPNETTYQYYFQESQFTTSDQINTPNFYSNRSISVTTNCQSESESDYTSSFPSSSLPASTLSPINSTTFYASPDDTTCGPRCSIVLAIENNGTSPSWVYTCNVTTSPVFNASVPEHYVSDDNARIAASAIALQGYQTTTAPSAMQSQIFPSQALYGQPVFGNATAMASKLSAFSTGVFASADQTLTAINGNFSGFLPNQGLELDIQDPKYMWVIFGGIAGAHLLLLVVGVMVANRVVVLDDDDLVKAMALRSVADDFRGRGGLLDSEERKKRGKDYRVVYAPREIGGKMGGMGERVLEISEEGDVVGDPRSWEGWYGS